MDDFDARISQLEAAILRLNIRATAHEWFIEQVTANLLIGDLAADEFLNSLSHDDGRSFVREGVREASPPPELKAALYEEVARIAEKVRTRVHQGYRKG